MRSLITFGLIGWLASQPAYLAASDTQIDRATLTGLPSISVVVEDLSAVAQKNGLAADTIEADALRRLRQAAVPITPDADAYLYIHVTVADPGGVSPLPYFVEVGLMQEVTLPRGVKARTPFQYETWSLNRLGLAAPAALRGAVTDRVGEFVDQFIAAYKSVNAR
jgi:hypothetical protein